MHLRSRGLMARDGLELPALADANQWPPVARTNTYRVTKRQKRNRRTLVRLGLFRANRIAEAKNREDGG
jgi:hypothetical protein